MKLIVILHTAFIPDTDRKHRIFAVLRFILIGFIRDEDKEAIPGGSIIFIDIFQGGTVIQLFADKRSANFENGIFIAVFNGKRYQCMTAKLSRSYRVNGCHPGTDQVSCKHFQLIAAVLGVHAERKCRHRFFLCVRIAKRAMTVNHCTVRKIPAAIFKTLHGAGRPFCHRLCVSVAVRPCRFPNMTGRNNLTFFLRAALDRAEILIIAIFRIRMGNICYIVIIPFVFMTCDNDDSFSVGKVAFETFDIISAVSSKPAWIFVLKPTEALRIRMNDHLKRESRIHIVCKCRLQICQCQTSIILCPFKGRADPLIVCPVRMKAVGCNLDIFCMHGCKFQRNPAVRDSCAAFVSKQIIDRDFLSVTGGCQQ